MNRARPSEVNERPLSSRDARPRFGPGVPIALAIVLAVGVPAAQPAMAAVHLWDITEVYSNKDGSIQYIEMSTAGSGETQTSGTQLRATSDGVETFTFPNNLSGSTANRHLLIATPGFENLPGAVTPDFTLPCGPFFDPGASSIVIEFRSSGGTTYSTFTATGLPTDGAQSFNRDSEVDDPSAAPNSPHNFADTEGQLVLEQGQIDGPYDACDDGLFCNGVESCSGSGCATTGSPCPEACIEESETCVECVVPANCDDDNPCTTDSCAANTCGYVNNDGPCDDGLFCTATDTCSEGVCAGAGDTCPGELCDEVGNACADCLGPADCADDLFCNGAEVCSGGACGAGSDPCPGELCDEAADACVECLTGPDCDDLNPCTDDACNAGSCQYTDNTDPCDDGLFCTATDACSGGACAGTGNPCAGGNCNEGPDTCGACSSNSDCDDHNPCTVDTCGMTSGGCETSDVTNGTTCTDDGLFCNGSEACLGGLCVSAGNPCDAESETCDEEGDACVDRCGDGLLDEEEDCDDGDDDDFDGCSATCTVEDGWACDTEGDPSVCTASCGDGVAAAGTEECDDGNVGGGDGCSAACAIEDGWSCGAGDTGTDECQPVTGDGLVVGDEQCDDGDDVDGDGCFDGLIEPGWMCDDGEPSRCSRLSACGDSAVDSGEACDDGNTEGGDGCSTSCTVEAGWMCDDGEPSACAEDMPVADPGPDAGPGAGGSGADDGGGCQTADSGVPPAWLSILGALGLAGLASRRRRQRRVVRERQPSAVRFRPWGRPPRLDRR